jgi:transposase
MTPSKAEPDDAIRGAARHNLNRGILDVGWYELGRQIAYKGEATGARLVAVDPGIFEGEGLSISNVCSVCGAQLARPASGRLQARCAECGHRELGDINAARNVRLRAEAMPPPAPKGPKVTIKIKGRVKRSETTENPSVDACGGDAPVRAPVEAGTLDPRGQHPTRTVVPRTPDGHPAHEERDS